MKVKEEAVVGNASAASIDIKRRKFKVIFAIIQVWKWDAAIFTTSRFTVDVLLAKSCCLLTFIHPKNLVLS